MDRTGKNYAPFLVEMVKAAGQEIIDRAEDLVGNGEMMTSFDIWLRFPQNEVPTIEVSREYFNKRGVSLYIGTDEQGEEE